MERAPNLSEETFLGIMKMVPICGVECIIKNSKGVLLVKRRNKPFKGYWHFPGSFIHYNERLEDAVKRCVKNEVGISVDIEKYVGYFDGIGVDPRGHYVAHIFLCRPKGVPPNTNSQGERIKFFKKLPKRMLSWHKKILEQKEF